MIPKQTLPHCGRFTSAEDYIEHLLEFVTTSDMFQSLCGGVHILDFFTSEPGLFFSVLPEEWHAFLLSCDIMKLLDILIYDDLDDFKYEGDVQAPQSFLDFVRSIRDFSLGRTFAPKKAKLPVLPYGVALGMKPKKIHEVVNFADYVDRLTEHVASEHKVDISHLVDFGSGQNYLGRTLASAPYNHNVVAVEGRENNVSAAMALDARAGLAIAPKIKRNKKLWNKIVQSCPPEVQKDPEAMAKIVKEIAGDDACDYKPVDWKNTKYPAEEGKGSVQYVSSRLDSGDLSDVVAKVKKAVTDDAEQDLSLMAISIHSCGNLSHYGIRSLLLNKDIRAVAIVGCCYNLLTEKLGPPVSSTYCRPTLQALNARVIRESARFDPQGFPMSERFSTYKGDGVRLNITARMMACQAPSNWTMDETEMFFLRHFYRAVLQRIFLDRGVVRKIRHDGSVADDSRTTVVPADSDGKSQTPSSSPFDTSTSPVVIGSLPKRCFASLSTYVRGVVDKLTSSSEFKQYGDVMRENMGNITDEEIASYEAAYTSRRKELAVVWTLMAFAAGVTESLIVADRWQFLKEHSDVVKEAWVETVFDYKQSPRNLVVVAVKRDDA